MNPPDKKPRNILLVDDDPLVIKVYAERMRYEGWIVAVAKDGWDALQEAKANVFDMILLDIRMPLQDGVEVLREIRQGETNAQTPVYILTGLVESEEVEDAKRLGADGVFYKSEVRPDELVKRIEDILVKRQAPAKAAAEPVYAAAATAEPAPAPMAVPEFAEEPAFGSEDSEEINLFDDVVEEEPPLPDRDFVLYVNPMLGDGAELSRALGMTSLLQCKVCGGQICLRLKPFPEAGPRELRGCFVCSQCGKEP